MDLKNLFVSDNTISEIDISKQPNIDNNEKANLIYMGENFLKNNIIDNIDNWILFDGSWCYIKNIRNNYCFFNELLGVIIAKYFNLDSISYKIVLIKNGHSKYIDLISKSLIENNSKYFYSPELNLKPYENLYKFNKSIYEQLSKYKNSEVAIKKLKSLIISDLYSNQTDRNFENLLFKIKDNHIDLAPLYDFELSFAFHKIHKYSNGFIILNLNDKNNIKILKEDDDFKNLIELLFKANMKLFIEELEDTHKILIPKNYANSYSEQDKKIKKLLYKKML